MAVVSKPVLTALPDKLERLIMLLASREPHELANYVRMAARFRYWSVYPNGDIN